MRKNTDRGRARLDLFSGSLFLWPARALFIGYAADTAIHAHHAVQICIAKRGTFRLRGGPTAPWRRFRAAVIAPDLSHQLDGGGSELLVLYLDPESEEGRGVQAISPGDVIRSISATQLIRTASQPMPADIEQGSVLVDGLVALLVPDRRQRRWLDARVARALDWLRSVSPGPRSASEVAARVSLSPGRFAHLFRDNTGVPLRRYLLWLRLVAAVQQMAAGGTLTEAAAAAGFSDSAHLTRTFRRMFGIAPSALVHGTKLVPPASGRS